MILDEYTEFLDAGALNTGVAGNYFIGDVVDTENDGINDVDNLEFVVQVSTAVLSAGAATVQFQLVSDAQAAIAVDGTATVHISTGAIPKATLVAGYTACRVVLPRGTYERYLGVLQITGVAALTAGAINAFLTPQSTSWKAFPDADNT